MKKLILLIPVILLLTSCNNNLNNIDNINNEFNNINNEQHNENKEKQEDYIDNNPIKIALYENNQIVKSYKTTLSNFKDIAVFDIYYTNEETTTENNTKNNFLKYYNQYQNIENYKTGLYISFTADGNKIEQLILNSSKTHAMSPYLYIYLYDDINQEPNTYYSHLDPEKPNDQNIISSVKLFLAQEGIKITSPITMTVFTYDSEEDFTKDNHYRGISSYTIEIEIK